MLDNSDKEAIIKQCYENAAQGGEGTADGKFYHANMDYYGEAKKPITLHLNPALVDHLCAKGKNWEAKLEDFITSAYAAHRI